MRTHLRTRFIVPVVFAGLLLTGCGGVAGPKKEVEAPAASGKRMPGSSAAHLTFPSGTTSLIVEGKLQPSVDTEFVIGEEAGSLILVHAMSPKHDPKVSVYRADTGAQIDDGHRNTSFFSGRLPATLGYLVVVHHVGMETEYALEIEVPRELHLDPKTSTAKITAWAPAGAPVTYLVRKSAKRAFSAELTSAPANAFLTLNVVDDGRALLKAEASARKFSGELPDQDSILRVHQGSASGDFTLALALK